MTNPCKGCTERAVGCHSGCEEYEGYRRCLDEQNAAKSRQKVSDSYFIEKSERVDKWRRQHEHKGGGHDG